MSNFTPLRVALVTQGYFTAGGVQTVARWLKSGLEESGHHVDVYNLAASRSDTLSRSVRRPATWLAGPRIELSADEERVWDVGAPLAEIEPARYLPRKVLSARLSRYDIVQVVSGGPSLALAASRAGRPLALQIATRIVWERASIKSPRRLLQMGRAANTRIVDRLERHALRAADAIFVENKQMLQFVRQHSRGTVVLAPPGVDANRFRPSATGWSPDGPIIAVGRLAEPRKGLDRVIAAYGIVCRSTTAPPPLVLAGRGQLPDTQARAIDALPANGRVSVRSDVPDEKLPELYREASIFVQGSHEEGLGLSVVEAMCSGIPVVATDTAGTRETLLHDSTGFLVDQSPDTAEIMAKHIQNILAGAGTQLAAASRARALQHFSTEATLKRFLQTYGEIATPNTAT